jgi:flagellar M-ring protein FliF
MADMETALPSNSSGPASLMGAGMQRKLFLAAGVAALIGVLITAALWSSTPDYKVLFANLDDRDGGTVLATLSQMNVPHRFSQNGSAILVPAEHVHSVRLKLASQGIPKNGTIGFELMESQKFGITQFQERLNFQRGLEGELARSIMSLSAVTSARVHLALPSQSGFLRDQLKPSASVLVALHPSSSLDRQQVAGIVHLVASSVPDLNPKQVSVVDQTGVLLSGTGDGSGMNQKGLDPGQLGYLRQIEAVMMQRIIDIVEPIVGRGNVRAQVSADVDFTQTESTAEEFKPNQGKDAVASVRSQQTSENLSKDAAALSPAQGIPGALSNQPPAQSSAPINGQAQPVQAANGGAAGAATATGSGMQRRDSVTNFEVDKTVRVTRNASGQVRRLTAAVLINHRKVTDPKGKVTMTPLNEKEIESITALIREATGMSKDRGDSVNVMNTAFNTQEQPADVAVPLWKDPEVMGMIKGIAKHVGLVMLGVLTIFMVIRPALKQLSQPQPRLLNQTVGDDLGLPAPNRSAQPATPADVLKLARDDPAMVANVVRNWVGKDG